MDIDVLISGFSNSIFLGVNSLKFSYSNNPKKYHLSNLDRNIIHLLDFESVLGQKNF